MENFGKSTPKKGDLTRVLVNMEIWVFMVFCVWQLRQNSCIFLDLSPPFCIFHSHITRGFVSISTGKNEDNENLVKQVVMNVFM